MSRLQLRLGTLVVACCIVSGPSPTAVAADSAVSGLLAELKVAQERSVVPYDRGLYRHWTDQDSNGCDTRREVLGSETLAPLADCLSNTGRWLSVYDQVYATDARLLEVDHVVALAEAHRSGADRWDSTRRESFANDLGSPWSLVAVTKASNRSKSDHDSTRWSPSTRTGRCHLAIATVATKWRWSLQVDRAEKAALVSLLKNCKGVPRVEVQRAAPVTKKAGSTVSSKTPTSSVEGTTAAAPAVTPVQAIAGSVSATRGTCPASHPVKGNIGRERIYHLPGTPYYVRTVPELCFEDAASATRSGFRPPRN